MIRPARPDAELIGIGLGALGLYAYVAYLLVFRLNIFVTDAMARTRSAWQVFFSHEPKLTNVGFIWAPLPTILQLPLVLFPPLRYRGLSANVVTVLAGAGAVVALALILRRAGLPRIIVWLILAAFALNPMTLYYAANGMSEMVMIAWIVTAVYFYLRWHETGAWLYVAGAGVASGMSFLSRYDALFSVGVMALLIAAEAFAQRPGVPRFAENVLLTYAAPAVYMVFMWLLANWLIQGDPLFFARSPYSNAGQIGYYLADQPWLVPLKGNVGATAKSTLGGVADLYPAFLVFSAGLIALAVARRAFHWLGILAIAWSFPFFAALNLYLGQSERYLRYLIAIIPLTVILAAGMLGLMKRFRTLGGLLLGAIMIMSGMSTAAAMNRTDNYNQWNQFFIGALLSRQEVSTWTEERKVADYLATKTTGLVLMDDFQGYSIIFFTGDAGRFITPADTDFKDYLHDPYGRIQYLLVTNPRSSGALNQVNQAFPLLWTKGAPWASLELEAGVWKLFRLTGPATRVTLEGVPIEIITP